MALQIKEVASQIKEVASQAKDVALKTKEVALETKGVASQTKEIFVSFLGKFYNCNVLICIIYNATPIRNLI